MVHFAIDITRDSSSSHAKLTVAGELDDASATELKSVDFSSLAGAGCRELDVDLGDLEFMDSSGIGALVNLRNRATSEGMTVTLERVPVHIAHTLAVTGLSSFFGIRATGP